LDEKEKKFQGEVKAIKDDYNNNKNVVINYLMDNVMKVDLSVPDVVRGRFSEKLR
jgi:hypothetical protein